MVRSRHLLTVLFVAFLAACRSTAPPSAVVSAIEARLVKPSGSPNMRENLQAFYTQRAHAPAWVTEKGKVARGTDILGALDDAARHGLSGDYDRVNIENNIAKASKLEGSDEQRAAAVADLDLQITSALLTLGHDVALGSSSPAAIDRRWKARREAPDFATTLNAGIDDPRGWLDQLKPVHQEYARLQKGLEALRGQQSKGGWPSVPARELKPGVSNPAVVVLRQRLAASGQLHGAAASSTSPKYDDDVVAAVKSFQEHHTLKVSGVADAPTIAAMNVPVDERMQQVAVNLERWRWMPDDFGARHFFVNIPSYHVFAREQGKDVLDIRVVVGKPGHETPVFSGEMETIVFSPYWNIPDAIAEGETVPALAKDSKYLERNHIEILRPSKNGVETVDPSSVEWDDEGATKGLMFRQRPGADNALGHVKFLFPNPFDVYLHDTPADALFSRTGRAFSHGCVRVEEPERLAQYVLRDSPEWTNERMLAAMNAGVEEHVKLPAKIPVHIAYFTASVDENGGLHLFDDVYGYDTKQLRR